jgi:hypothetical protein
LIRHAVAFDRGEQYVDPRLALGQPFQPPAEMCIDDQHGPAVDPHARHQRLPRLVFRHVGQGDAA